MRANETKSVHVTFTLKTQYLPVHLNNKQLTQTDDLKYLGIHLDRYLTWHNYISIKRKQFELRLRKLFILFILLCAFIMLVGVHSQYDVSRCTQSNTTY
jgi:hypothetical protein